MDCLSYRGKTRQKISTYYLSLGVTVTWKEFKNLVENEGVTDDMTIDYMDFNDLDCDRGIGVYIEVENHKTTFTIH
jgi:hypothetical protein